MPRSSLWGYDRDFTSGQVVVDITVYGVAATIAAWFSDTLWER